MRKSYQRSGFKVAYNVFALGAVADFGAKNCQATTKADARHDAELTTTPPLLAMCCYTLYVLIFCALAKII